MQTLHGKDSISIAKILIALHTALSSALACNVYK